MDKLFLQYMNTPVRQARKIQNKLHEWFQWLTEATDSPLSGSLPSDTTAKPKPQDDENEATKQAHALGLESDGYGYWKDPKTGKRVARTLKGKLVKLASDEPYQQEKPKKKKNKPPVDLGLGMPQAKSKYDKYDHDQGNLWKGHFHSDEPWWGKGKSKGSYSGGGGYSSSHTHVSGSYYKTSEPVHTSPNELKWTIEKGPEISELNGIPLDYWLDAPTTTEGWQNVVGKNPDIQEPEKVETKYKNDKLGAGVIIIEPDGRVWIVEPMGHYMGVKHTFPKGTLDPGLDLQSTAIKEAFEESGLQVELTDWLGDVTRTSSTARYYLAKRVGGSPQGHGIETQSVSLVPVEEAIDFVNQAVDKKVARMMMKKLGIQKPLNLPKSSNIMAQKIGGQKGTNPGGLYKGKDGVERYVKFYDNPTRAWDEKLANDIYRDLKIGAPKSTVFEDEKTGKQGFASEIVPGKVDVHGKFDKELADKLLDGFAADVLLSNWDVMGLWNDNILKATDPKTNDVIPYRIDNGGVLLHRAQGAPKPENALDTPTEWDFFPSKGQFAQVFQALGIKNADALGKRVVSQIDKIKYLESAYGGWDTYVEEHAPGLNPKDFNRVVQMLTKRSQWLYNKADELWKKSGGTTSYKPIGYTSDLPPDDDFDLWKQQNKDYYKPDTPSSRESPPSKDKKHPFDIDDDEDDRGMDDWYNKHIRKKK